MVLKKKQNKNTMEIFYINSIGCFALFICLLIKILPTHNIVEAIARDPF